MDLLSNSFNENIYKENLFKNQWITSNFLTDTAYSLGKTPYGEVYSIKSADNNKMCAVKIINLLDRSFCLKVPLDNAHIINVEKYFSDSQQNNGFLIMEQGNGNLTDFLKINPNETLKFDLIFQLLESIVSSLEYAYEKKIPHLNIKPENIIYFKDKIKNEDSNSKKKCFLDGNIIFKLSDFGFDQIIYRENLQNNINNIAGYIAPELFEDLLDLEKKKLDQSKIDIFSLGMIIVNCFGVKYQKFQDLSRIYSRKKYKVLIDEIFKYLEQDYPQTFKEIVKKMIEFDPKERIDIQKLRDFIRNVENHCQTENDDLVNYEEKIQKIYESLHYFYQGYVSKEQIEELFKDNMTVINILHRAQTGDAKSQFLIGRMYSLGNGVPINKKMSLKWYFRSAEQGNSDAENNIGIDYHDKEGIMFDEKEALKWYKKSNSRGNDRGLYSLGIFYEQKKEFTKAYKFYKELADKSDPSGIFKVAWAHENGKGVPKNLEISFKYLKKLVEYGNPEYQGILGNYYLYGWSVQQDIKEAIKWFKIAGRQNEVKFLYFLGDCYRKSKEGVEKNLEMAKKYLIQAGNMKEAQFSLGEIFMEENDEFKAFTCYKNAANQGYYPAVEKLRNMKKY